MVMIQIDDERLDQLTRSLEATPDEADRAFRLSLSTLERRVRVLGARAAGIRTGSFLRNRIKSGREPDGSRRIWFGLNPVGANAFVTPAQARSQQARRNGVFVPGNPGRRYPKGFWIRRGPRLGAVQRVDGKLQAIRIDIQNPIRARLADLHAELPEIFSQEYERQLGRLLLRRTGAQ